MLLRGLNTGTDEVQLATGVLDQAQGRDEVQLATGVLDQAPGRVSELSMANLKRGERGRERESAQHTRHGAHDIENMYLAQFVTPIVSAYMRPIVSAYSERLYEAYSYSYMRLKVTLI